MTYIRLYHHKQVLVRLKIRPILVQQNLPTNINIDSRQTLNRRFKMNTCYIYQPHFNTNCFRVAKREQQGREDNYVVVCCSPKFNGVYRWNPLNAEKYSSWKNGSLDCYCVPVKDCIYIKSLENLTNPDVIKHVKKLQKKWFENEVRNRNYEYTKRPEWMI